MKIAVIGAGLMGRAALYDLVRADSVEHVGIFDIDEKLAAIVSNQYGDGRSKGYRLDAGDEEKVAETLRQYDAAVSCVTYRYNPGLTRAAIKGNCHLVDLGGNNDTVAEQRRMDADAEKAGVIVVPDCGLAPGMVAIMVADAVNKLETVSSVNIRVGGLPANPRPPLNYQMLFSAEGLINEYWEPCVILKDGQKRIVDPMTGLEELEFDGIGKLEAFYTSGGTSTLPDTLGDKIRSLDYKTIRYPGHCQLFRPMLEIGLASRVKIRVGGQTIEPRAAFKAVLDANLSFDEPDIALVRVSASGQSAGRDRKIEYEIIDRKDEQTGLTAMMRTTAFPAAIVAWMAAAGKITGRGVKPQELVVDPAAFFTELDKRGVKLTIRES